MNDENVVFQIGGMILQIFGYVIAIARVIGHHKEDSLLAVLLMFLKRVAPFNDAKVKIVCIPLSVFRTLPLLQFGAAGGVGQHWMLDDILGDCLNEGIISDCLDEDRSVFMFGCGSYVHLQR